MVQYLAKTLTCIAHNQNEKKIKIQKCTYFVGTVVKGSEKVHMELFCYPQMLDHPGNKNIIIPVCKQPTNNNKIMFS